MHTLKWFHNFLCQFSLHFTNLLKMLSMHTRKSDFLFRYGLSVGFGIAYFCVSVCIVFVFICVCNIVGPANRTRRDLPCTHKNQTKAPSARKQLKRRKCASDWETLFHIRRDAESTRRSAALRAEQSSLSLLLLFLLSLGAFVLTCSLPHSHTSIWPPSAKFLRASDMLDVSECVYMCECERERGGESEPHIFGGTLWNCHVSRQVGKKKPCSERAKEQKECVRERIVTGICISHKHGHNSNTPSPR